MARASEVQLGDRVKERITGFTGIITAMTSWLNGCTRVNVQPEKLDNEGKPREQQAFDVEQIDVVKKGVHKPKVLIEEVAPPPKPNRTGGPARKDPSRF